MTTAVRLEGLSEHSWLTQFAGADLDWWLVRADEPAVAPRPDRAVAAATGRLLSSAVGASGTWGARIDGKPGAVQYALEVTPGVYEHVGGRRRAGWIVLRGLDEMQARSLLDAAETVAVSVALFRTSVDASMALSESLSGATATLNSVRPDLAVIKAAGTPWSVLGTPRGTVPPSVTGLRVLEHSVGVRPPDVGVDVRERSPGRIRAVAAAGAAVLIVLVGGALAVWRLSQPGTPTVPPGGSGPESSLAACTVWATAEAGLPSTTGSPSIADDEAESGSPVVFFGGIGNESKTWLWSAQRWMLAHPSATPPGRNKAALAYDPTTHDLLLFGGVLATGRSANDTWSWNGCTWTRVGVQSAGPPGGPTAGMTWDHALNRMVLLTYDAAAGADATETWTWSGSRWLLSATANASPKAQALVTAGDPATGWPIAVSVSGDQSNPYAPSTTWTWDGTRWRELATTHSPWAGFPAALAVDPLTNQLVLTGASRTPANDTNQTWTWNGTDWSLLQPDREPPAPTAAVDNNSDGVLEAFGWGPGVPSASPALHVWAWSGTTWVRLADGADAAQIPGTSPSAGLFTGRAYDATDHQLVLFADAANENGVSLPPLDTWTFDGTKWTARATSTHPPASGSMVFDPFNGTVLLVTNPTEGTPGPVPANRTWRWNGSTWRALRPPSEITLSESVSAMVADPANGTIVALARCCIARTGPASSIQTWTWNGSTWPLLHPATAFPADLEFVIAYDAASRRIIAVGNQGAVGAATTWAWDGRTWTELQPNGAATFDPVTSTMASDPENQTVVLVATVVGDTGTQVWNGSFWIPGVGLIPTGADTGDEADAMYYDETVGQLLMISSTPGDLNEEWMWAPAGAWLQIDPVALVGASSSH